MLAFLEEHIQDLLTSSEGALSKVLEAIEHLIRATSDDTLNGVALRCQAISTATAVAIALDDLRPDQEGLGDLVQFLLGIVRHGNAIEERTSRAVAADCLRILEETHPGVLSQHLPVLLDLAETERSSAFQSYALLAATVMASAAGALEAGMTMKGVERSRLEQALLLFVSNLVHMTAPAVVDMVCCVNVILPALELSPAKISLELSPLLNCIDPLLSLLMLERCWELPGLAELQDYAALLRRLMAIANDSTCSLATRQLAVLWLSSTFRRAQAASSAEDEHLPAVAALGWDWRLLLPDFADGPQVVIVKSIAVVDILAAGYGDAEDVLCAYHGLPGLWLEHPELGDAAAAAMASLAILLSERPSPGIQSTLCTGVSRLLLEVVRSNHKYVHLLDLLLGESIANGKRQQILSALHAWLTGNPNKVIREDLFAAKGQSLWLPQAPKIHHFWRAVKRMVGEPATNLRDICQLMHGFARHMIAAAEPKRSDASISSWEVGIEMLDVLYAAMHAHEPSTLLPHCEVLLTLMSNSYPSLDVRDRSAACLRLMSSLPGCSTPIVLAPPEAAAGVANHGRGGPASSDVRCKNASILPAVADSPSSPQPASAASQCRNPGPGSLADGGNPDAAQLHLQLQPERRDMWLCAEASSASEGTQSSPVCDAKEVLRACQAALLRAPPPTVRLPCRLSYIAPMNSNNAARERSPAGTADLDLDASSPLSEAIFGVEVTFEVVGAPEAVLDEWHQAPCGDFSRISALHVEYLKPAGGPTPHSASAVELVIAACPLVSLPTSLLPRLRCSDGFGSSRDVYLPALHIMLQDFFLPVPRSIQADPDVLFEAMWGALIASDQARPRRSETGARRQSGDGPEEASGASVHGWHTTTVIRSAPAAWWPQAAEVLRPFLVDSGAEQHPLPTAAMGGGSGHGGAQDGGEGTSSAGTRVLIFLAPDHFLLLRLWAECEDGGVLAHIATDFHPVLYYVDKWLVHGEAVRELVG